MKTITFIRYDPKYQDAIIELHHSAIEGLSIGIDQNDEETDLRNIEKTYINTGGEFIIGLINGVVVAMGGFRRSSSTTAELRRMRIQKKFQGKGYGSQLLSELERIARLSGIREFCFETAKSRPRTLEFYRKHGYKETGEGYYGQVRTIHFSKVFKK